MYVLPLIPMAAAGGIGSGIDCANLICFGDDKAPILLLLALVLFEVLRRACCLRFVFLYGPRVEYLLCLMFDVYNGRLQPKDRANTCVDF